LALDPPGWLLAELGPVPSDPRERAVWRVAAAELDAYRRTYGLDHLPPAEHVGGRIARDGRAAAPATAPTAARDGEPHRSVGRRGRSERARQPLRARRDPTAAERHGVEAARLLGAEPRRDTPGRRRDWQTAWAALERLADHHHRGRDDRHRPHERASRLRGRDLGRQERDSR
jgi:hypothetical protein